MSHPGLSALDELCVNTIRFLAVDAVEKAQSGHPGMPMGMAPAAYVLWTRHLRYSPANPLWHNRDRFVLSGGHGSMLLYSLLYLSGYGLTLEDLTQLRQWQSKTPGHPEYGLTPGVEVTTGPLGQGFGQGVGMAIAATHLASVFNKPGYNLIDSFIYAIVTDGDLMEGVSSEAGSLAGHLQLGRLVYLYDDNHISIDGSTDLAFTEDRLARFAAYGWHVQSVADGTDTEAIDEAIKAAKADPRPSIIGVRNIIGYGAPTRQGTAKAHGEALGCVENDAWVTAVSDGLILRAQDGAVIQDLDGDGLEQTGWIVLYLHVESRGRVQPGTYLKAGDHIGHPSCEGGSATGTHIHVARLYNGEWMPAEGMLPFDLEGWIAHAGSDVYLGTLTRENQTVVACTCSNARSFVQTGRK